MVASEKKGSGCQKPELINVDVVTDPHDMHKSVSVMKSMSVSIFFHCFCLFVFLSLFSLFFLLRSLKFLAVCLLLGFEQISFEIQETL